MRGNRVSRFRRSTIRTGAKQASNAGGRCGLWRWGAVVRPAPHGGAQASVWSGERERKILLRVGPPVAEGESRCGEFCFHSLAAEFGGDLGAHLLSCGEG